ncbi:MAG: class I SAM-dependent methyltransferase [Actinomycetia bacterium]|nr:class I SAM-dependent methyltransferase [Actinomycetes bacterium]
MRVAWLFLRNRIITKDDIAASYDAVSSKYDDVFMGTMSAYNDELLEQAVRRLRQRQGLSILDLACGTGYNIGYLRAACPGSRFDAVDISSGMLGSIPGAADVVRHHRDMLSFLESAGRDTYDLIVCSWALKYQNPRKLIRQCYRVLRQNGVLAVIVNTRQTLPEVRRVYPKLLANNVDRIDKLMLELPNPKTEADLLRWARSSGFSAKAGNSLSHVFWFDGPSSAVEFVTSTGALAGFDAMIDLRDRKVKGEMAVLFGQAQTRSITHSFVYGVFEKEELG